MHPARAQRTETGKLRPSVDPLIEALRMTRHWHANACGQACPDPPTGRCLHLGSRLPEDHLRLEDHLLVLVRLVGRGLLAELVRRGWPKVPLGHYAGPWEKAPVSAVLAAARIDVNLYRSWSGDQLLALARMPRLRVGFVTDLHIVPAEFLEIKPESAAAIFILANTLQREAAAWSAAYDDVATLAITIPVALSNALVCPWRRPDELRASNRMGNWFFWLDDVIEGADSDTLVDDLIEGCRAVVAGEQPSIDHSLMRDLPTSGLNWPPPRCGPCSPPDGRSGSCERPRDIGAIVNSAVRLRTEHRLRLLST